MVSVFKSGTEFKVNSDIITTPLPGGFTFGATIGAAVATFADGGFVVTWSAQNSLLDGSGSAVRAQLFDAAGARVGGEFMVNTQGLNSQYQPAVTTLANGDFVVAWTTADTAQDGSELAVKAQRFDRSGTAQGGEFLVNTDAAGNQQMAEITSLANGGFVVSWTSGGYSDSDIKAQVFDAAGSKVGAEFRVNSTITGVQSAADITTLVGGNFVVTWNDPNRGGDLRGRIFTAAGTPLANDFELHNYASDAQSLSSVTALAGGGFVVTWQSAYASGDSDGAVMGQVYGATGAKVGSEFRVNTVTYSRQSQPSVTGLADGGFLVAYTTENQTSAAGGDLDAYAVMAQAFSATGVKLGGEFLVNTLTSGYQSAPALATLADGRVVAVWANEPANYGAVTVEAQFLTPNIAPEIVSSDAVTVALGETVVTAVQADDAGGGQAIGYAITGGADAALFSIDAVSGALSFVAAPTGTGVFEVVVRASDGELTDSQTVQVTVVDVADPVVITSGGSVAVDENGVAVTVVTASDPDSDPIGYAIAGGADAHRFRIDALTGALRFVAAPDFEARADADHDNVYDVIVAASDGASTDVQTLAVTLGNLNDVAPKFDLWTAPSISMTHGENRKDVYTFGAKDADGDTITYSLSGADAALFSINAATGRLDFLTAPDYEAPGSAAGTNSYNVVITADDGAHATTLGLKLIVNNSNEALVITSNGGGDTGSVSLLEGDSAVAAVLAADPENAAITYSIKGGADAARFAIDAKSGALTFVAATDFEAPADAGGDNVYDVIVGASDGTFSDSQALSVTVTDRDETPVITSNGGGAEAALSVAEGETKVTTVAATSPGAQAATYAIAGGADAALFTIDSVTGALAFAAAPDFEAPADADGNNVYDVIVRAANGGQEDLQTLAISVSDVDGTPVISSNGGGATAAVSVAENGTAVTTVVAASTEGDAVTYAIAGGADAARFVIDKTTGVLAFVAAPDFELPGDTTGDNVYDVVVRAATASKEDTQALAITVTDDPGEVAITSNGGGSTAAVAIDENGKAVTTFTASGSAPVTWAIAGGADAGRFAIDSATGVLSFTNAPDFEVRADVGANNVYDVVVKASDGATSDTQALAVTVRNVNEAPVITSHGGGATGVAYQPEGMTLLTVTASDPEGDKRSFSIIGGADADRFTYQSTGEIAFKVMPDFEAPGDADGDNVYEIEVAVSDGSLQDSQKLAIVIDNVKEAPVITSNGGGGSAFLPVAENQVQVTTVTATDGDFGPAPSFSISGGSDAARFAINAVTGALTFKAAPNYEAPTDSNLDNIYQVVVRAVDSTGLSDTQTLSIVVGNVNEAPTFATSTYALSTPENALTTYTVKATDLEGAALAYSITGGADAARFIVSATGILRLASTPNYEAPTDADGNNRYEVEVSATDGTFSAVHAITWTVTDVMDGKTFTGSSASETINGTSEGDVLRGMAGNDTIYGGGGDDQLDGGTQNDTLVGGAGADKLTGGTGMDTFVISTLSDSTAAAPDWISDFDRAEGDKLSLSGVDADETASGNQAFAFIGGAAFSGNAGELRYYTSSGSTYVSGDVDGDGIGDLLIRLTGSMPLTPSAFVL